MLQIWAALAPIDGTIVRAIGNCMLELMVLHNTIFYAIRPGRTLMLGGGYQHFDSYCI